MSKNKPSVNVDKRVYALAKAGTINCLLFALGSENANKFEEEEEPITEVEIINADNPKQRITRRVDRTDSVKHGYRGRGYPDTYRTTQDNIRVMIDMVIEKQPENELAKEVS
ncbi:MAG: hypothetical protein ACFB2Y_16810 [Fulvivirga sp.]